MLRNVTKTYAGLVTLAYAVALLSLPAEILGQDIGFKDWTYDSYGTTGINIFRNYGKGSKTGAPGMSNSFNRSEMKLAAPGWQTTPAGSNHRINVNNGKTQYKMTYNFGYSDATFGTDGLYSLLENTNTGRSLYNITSDWQKKFQDPQGNQTSKPIADASSALKADSTPWLSVAGANKTGDELYQYLMNRSDQWSLTNDQGDVIKPWEDGDGKNPYRRTAAALGMSYNLTQHNHQPTDPFGGYHYSNNYVVTMWVDEDAFYRPNANQNILNLDAESAPFQEDELLPSGWNPDQGWDPAWEGSLVGVNWKPDESGPYDSFGSFYHDWWNGNDPQGNFPWSGIGYTYDWYYQNHNTGKGWDEYWTQKGPDSSDYGDYYFGQGISEFVLLQSNPTASLKAQFEVVDVQTTYQYLGGQNGPWGFSVPEPTTLTIFSIAVLAGLGIHRRRRRSADRI